MCCQESGEREAVVQLFCPKAKKGEPKIRKVRPGFIFEGGNFWIERGKLKTFLPIAGNFDTNWGPLFDLCFTYISGLDTGISGYEVEFE